jgi:hypothetical protein
MVFCTVQLLVFFPSDLLNYCAKNKNIAS